MSKPATSEVPFGMVVRKIAVVCPEASVSIFDRFLLESTLDLLRQAIAEHKKQVGELEVTVYTSQPICEIKTCSSFHLKYSKYYDTCSVFNEVWKKKDFKALIHFKNYLIEKHNADIVLVPSGESGNLFKRSTLYFLNDCFLQTLIKPNVVVYLGISKHIRFKFLFLLENMLLSLTSRKTHFLITTRDKDSFTLLNKSLDVGVYFGSDLLFNSSISRYIKMCPFNFGSIRQKFLINLDKIPEQAIKSILDILQIFQTMFCFYYLIVEEKSWRIYRLVADKLSISPLCTSVSSLLAKLREEPFIVITNRLHLTILSIVTYHHFIAISEKPAKLCKIYSLLRDSVLHENWLTIEDQNWIEQFKKCLNSIFSHDGNVSGFTACICASLARSTVNRQVMDFVLDYLSTDGKVVKLTMPLQVTSKV
ncbi:MAG: polysaccharide pyruvyl transferase family protein [Candidatus Bathyarchaeia archaeon]